MDFSVQKLGEKDVKCFDSGTGSEVQLVFVPGVFPAEIWKHQLRYFSQDFRTICCQKLDDRGYGAQREVLENLLEKRDLGNAVLVSSHLGNSLVQELERHENVVATVMTGARRSYSSIPKSLYQSSWLFGFWKPKLTKKLFFSEKTDYRIVSEFLDDIEMPSYEEFSSFVQNYSLGKPVKNSLLVHPVDDRCSSEKYARELKPNVYVSKINRAGTFSFYEKPEEYNKAVLDFLSRLEGFVRSRKVNRLKDRNRSLKEFEKRPVMRH